jgi:hypothetical protein
LSSSPIGGIVSRRRYERFSMNNRRVLFELITDRQHIASRRRLPMRQTVLAAL